MVENNNYTRKRIKIGHYPEIKYNNPVDFVKTAISTHYRKPKNIQNN